MTTNHARLVVAATGLLVLLTGCGPAGGSEPTPSPGPGTSGRGIQLHRTAPDPQLWRDQQCAYSADLIQHMMDVGQPLPRCVREKIRAFEQSIDGNDRHPRDDRP